MTVEAESEAEALALAPERALDENVAFTFKDCTGDLEGHSRPRNCKRDKMTGITFVAALALCLAVLVIASTQY
jgi:hypothetical protein